MRFLKTLYLIALFSLSMGLFCGELPEEMRLRDDTSNDYVNDSSASAVKENEAARKEKEQVPKECIEVKSTVLVRETPVVHSAGPTFESGQSLLQLLSISRT
jgi:hypothetical protein